MKTGKTITRRHLVRSSVLGLLATSVPNILFSKNLLKDPADTGILETKPHSRYPAIRLEVASEVVGVSHFNLDRLRELVDPRPELAKSTWDWGFGDWESAMAAATHVGRKDIVDYLVSKGAIPTIFTFAMLGEHTAVKTLVESYPGIQRNLGPHGISLLQHARTGLQVSGVNKQNAQKLIGYLEQLGDADGKVYLQMEEAEKEKYIGDYKYGTGTEDGFTIKLNMRKLLSLGNLGKSGGALLRLGPNEFTYQGAPSVNITFQVENGHVISFILKEPGLTLKAIKTNAS